MRRRVMVGLVCMGVATTGLEAQGTKLWSVGRYDEMQRGTAEGVAIRSDGRLEAGPVTSPVYMAGASYVWSVATDAAGVAYVGMGGSTSGSAAVVRVGVDGKAQKVFAGKELGVQAVRVGADGAVYVATSPDGKVYRLGRSGEVGAAGAEGAGATGAEVVFDPATTAEKPKYLWDLAVGRDGAVYAAAGAPAVVYRVRAGAKGSAGGAEVLFRTADQHIRCLAMAGDGVLWAGSDGAGVVYKISTTAAGARPFAAYAAGRREITALALGDAGEVYAAAVGAKSGSTLPPLPVTGNVGVTVTFLQPGSATAASANTVVPEGSEIDRIAAEGTPSRLLTLRDDVVYALAVRGGAVLAASGNRGRVYRVDPRVAGQFTEVARVEGAAQATALAATKGGLLVGTSNGGKVMRLGDVPATVSRYTSEVFDTGQIARWGRVEVQYGGAAATFDVWVRTGNVPSSVEGWSDWVKVRPNVDFVAGAGAAGVPPGRYAQWRAELRAGADVNAVALNYLARNVAPVVDEVVVALGARVAATPVPTPSPTVQVVFPAAAGAAGAISFVQDAGTSPLTAQKDRTAVTVRWAAHDDNGDDLMFAVWYRGANETNWRLLKDKISERFLSFDASLLPDGSYVTKVVASDAPVHVDADALTGERVSAGFTVDTTPPVPGMLTARLETGASSGQTASGAQTASGLRVHVLFEARDATSPIAHAEFSVDAGPWQYVEPVGGLSDSLAERYDFVAAVPTASGEAAGGIAKPGEHVVAMRVFDRFENMASVKAVVQ